MSSWYVSSINNSIEEEPTKNETVIMLLLQKRNRHFGSCWEYSPELLLQVRDCGFIGTRVTLSCSRREYRHASVTCRSCVCDETAVHTDMAASTMPVAMDTHLVRLRVMCRASYSAIPGSSGILLAYTYTKQYLVRQWYSSASSRLYSSCPPPHQAPHMFVCASLRLRCG